MIHQTNHLLTERLEVIAEEQVDWQAWARANDFIGAGQAETLFQSPPETLRAPARICMKRSIAAILVP